MHDESGEFNQVYMRNWVLEVCLDGEWERCQFSQPDEAKNAFADLVMDYGSRLLRASLYSPEGNLLNLHLLQTPAQSVNVRV